MANIERRLKALENNQPEDLVILEGIEYERLKAAGMTFPETTQVVILATWGPHQPDDVETRDV